MNKVKNFDAIIYHGPCSDGTCGLWCACHYSPIKTRYACKAGLDPTGDYTNMNVIFIDICPKFEYLIKLVKIAKHVVILDHHKSSEQIIKNNSSILSQIKNLHIEFDMDRSGCQLAWDYFFDNLPRPFFIDYIADRDLWTWKLPASKEINTALYELEYINSYNLNKLTELMENSEEKIKYLETSGKIIEIGKKREIDIGLHNAVEATMCFKDKTYRIWLGGNINPTLRSELGNLLCSKPFKDGSNPDFSACWQYNPKTDEWWISLRSSSKNSPDLSVISLEFGGGGHPNASGFTIGSCSKGLKKIFIY